MADHEQGTGGLFPEDAEAVVALRRRLHRIPELGMEEHRTCALIRTELAALGLRPEAVTETGTVAVLDSGRPGRTLLLRADIDGLPVEEQTSHSYASEHPGRMHACGHDGHTAALLVATRVLRTRLRELTGRVVLVFQPGEEARGGAQAMLDAGLLRRFPADCCAGLHLWSLEQTGTILATDGPFMAGMDGFEVTVRGVGGHGAMPHLAKDPIVAASRMILGLQTVVSREVDPLQPAVVTVGRIRGGDAWNVIPSEVGFAGTVRAFDKDVQRSVEESIRRIVTETASASRVDVEIEYPRFTIPVVNAPGPCSLVREAAARVPGAVLGPAGYRTCVSEDFAFFLDRIPGVFFFVGACNPAVGAAYPHHHPKFEIDEAALPVATGMLVELAVRILAGPLPPVP